MPDIQDIIVVAIVAGAGWYVVRMLWRTFTGRPTCGCGTGHCSQPGPTAGSQQVSLNVEVRADQRS